MLNCVFLLCLKTHLLLHERRFRRIVLKEMMKIKIFKQNVMIREHVDQRSFRFRKCDRIIS